ncbi:MAG: PAS domain S-box protein [Actinobacteria bacterium]|nr:PAS domain S-box protein [Actinomycetota bacterium]
MKAINLECSAATATLQHFEKLAQQSIERAVDLIQWANPEGRIIFVNHATCARTGYSPDELQGMYLWDLDIEMSRESWAKRWTRLKEVRSRKFESRHRTKTGESYPVEVSASYVEQDGREYSFGFARDVSERRAAEQSLRESEERNRVLVDTTSDLIFSFDPSLCLTGINRAAAHLLGGLTVDAAIGRHLSELGLPEETWRRWEERCLEVLESGQVISQPSREVTLANGAKFVLETDLWPISQNGGKPIGVRGISRDITERIKAEETLKERDEQLRQAQKMEAIGRLAGGIAHDFNNVLTTIIGYSDLILADPGHAGTLREDVGEIKVAAERASTLTRQILAFSRRQTLQPEILCLNDVLKELQRLLARTLGENIEVVLGLAEDLGLVEVDAHQLEQVLLNLSINARDAMPEGGRLTLETANIELGPTSSSKDERMKPGSYVMLSVADTGVGMSEEVRSHLFEPFFTTKEQGKGTGLGLATAYGTVRQSGGSIFVQSEPGKGSTFRIYLPRADRAPATPSYSRPMYQSQFGIESIFVVEDEVAVRELVKRTLERHGYSVTVAPNGDEALAMLQGLRRPPDLLLTDVVLTGSLQGNELAERTRDVYPAMPVLYMSGYTRNAIVHSGNLEDGVNYIEKPFAPEALARRVREILDRQRAGLLA